MPSISDLAHGSLGAKGADSETFFSPLQNRLLPESNLHLRAAGCCALPARPAPGSKGVSATWFPAVFAGDFVWGRGGAGAGREWAMSCQSERAAGRQNRGRAARARRELRCAPVRPGSIEAPAPSAALCEATTSAARSTPSLGVKTAVFSPPQEPAEDFGLVSATSVAACARCGWHVGASGRNERLWTDPNWRSSPAGPGRSAAPAAHGRHDHTFHAPSQPGGLMCARDEDEAQATSPGPGRLVRAPSRAARSVRPHCHCLHTTAHHLLTAPSSLRASVLRHSRLMVLALCTRRWRPRTTA